MKRRLATKPVVPSLALAAIAIGVTGCPDGPPGIADRSPFRDGWVVEVDADFVHTDAEGTRAIFDMTVGGREDGDNFANRGDIIVTFDGPPNRILVEMRRFTFSTNQEAADLDFDDLSLWAFASSTGRPQDQDPADDCSGSWQNACQVRVYFDGLSQLERSGADLRVTLPPDYRQKINIVTQDNIEEEDYLNRGNVCVSNLFASANIETESGKVWAQLARDVNPAPKCSLEQIDKCENWTVDDGMGNDVPAAWAPECDCIAVGGGEFGRLAIDSRDETAADIVVDVPDGLWASIKAENQGDGQEEAGDHCEAKVEVANFERAETGNDFSWQAFGNANYPGMPAIGGAGFSINAISSSCEPVAYTERPEDFVGTGKGEDQDSEERGNVTVCTNCITQSCSELIP
ncbi:hypothetical protein [Paraliomyxa miuraensis]|uniref:hypothetical protein n=1 Tax=Paraliomyxa miuraensis TaxID=376150 RepID=UPI002252ACFD|nr:hypothetical protein [Paraliomyxa miuraensis]MCX4240413.1 hypothetical protein [Paraliomyxa miuraensis]